jgi:hypothetical protein
VHGRPPDVLDGPTLEDQGRCCRQRLDGHDVSIREGWIVAEPHEVDPADRLLALHDRGRDRAVHALGEVVRNADPAKCPDDPFPQVDGDRSDEDGLAGQKGVPVRFRKLYRARPRRSHPGRSTGRSARDGRHDDGMLGVLLDDHTKVADRRRQSISEDAEQVGPFDGRVDRGGQEARDRRRPTRLGDLLRHAGDVVGDIPQASRHDIVGAGEFGVVDALLPGVRTRLGSDLGTAIGVWHTGIHHLEHPSGEALGPVDPGSEDREGSISTFVGIDAGQRREGGIGIEDPKVDELAAVLANRGEDGPRVAGRIRTPT